MKHISLTQKFLFLLTKQHKRKLFVLLILTLFGVLFEMLGITMFIPLIAVIISPEKFVEYGFIGELISLIGYSAQIDLVLFVLVFIIIVFVLKTLYLSYLYKFQSRFANEFILDSSVNLFAGYLRQPYHFHVNTNSSNLIKNVQGNISNLSNITQAGINLMVEVSILFGVISLIVFSTPIGGIVIISCLFGLVYLFNKANKKKLTFWGERKQILGGILIKDLQESFGGVKDLIILNKQEYFINKYKKNYEELSVILGSINILNLLPRLYLELFAILVLCGLVLVLNYFGDPATVIPILGIFVAGSFRMIPSANRIISSMQIVRYCSPVIDVLYQEFVMIKSNNYSNIVNKNIPIFNNTLSVNVNNFKYGKDQDFSLSEINLKILKGCSIGILGPSGSGKSTLIDIIIGLYPIENGKVLIDEINVQLCLKNYQKLIGYVPQNIYLMDDTLKKNIAFGVPDSEISDKQIENVIKLSKIDQFVNELEFNVDTIIGERGVKLSGGQRQRIGIARALYHNPEILILDEATSALDNVTERAIMDSVYSFQGEKTIIIVAHRHSTVENCDILYYIKNGKIIDSGIPKNLLNKYK